MIRPVFESPTHRNMMFLHSPWMLLLLLCIQGTDAYATSWENEREFPDDPEGAAYKLLRQENMKTAAEAAIKFLKEHFTAKEQKEKTNTKPKLTMSAPITLDQVKKKLSNFPEFPEPVVHSCYDPEDDATYCAICAASQVGDTDALSQPPNFGDTFSVYMACGHAVCSTCATKINENSEKCAVCRNRYTTSGYAQEYDCLESYIYNPSIVQDNTKFDWQRSIRNFVDNYYRDSYCKGSKVEALHNGKWYGATICFNWKGKYHYGRTINIQWYNGTYGHNKCAEEIRTLSGQLLSNCRKASPLPPLPKWIRTYQYRLKKCSEFTDTEPSCMDLLLRIDGFFSKYNRRSLTLQGFKYSDDWFPVFRRNAKDGPVDCIVTSVDTAEKRIHVTDGVFNVKTGAFTGKEEDAKKTFVYKFGSPGLGLCGEKYGKNGVDWLEKSLEPLLQSLTFQDPTWKNFPGIVPRTLGTKSSRDNR